MRHDLLTLELLLAIAQTKSITRGAAEVHLALAAASKRLSDLEARLGVKLFVRRARGVEPTEACSVLLKHVQTVNTALDAFDREAIEFSRGIKGYARVAVSRDVAVDGLLQELAGFSRKHKDVHVTLRDLRGTEVADAVANGSVDVGVFMLDPAGTRLHTWPYARGRWTVLVPDRHPFASRATVHFEELLGQDLVGSDRSGLLASIVAREAANLGMRFETRVDAESVEAAAALVAAGIGLAVTTEAAAQRSAQNHRVRCLTLADTWASYELVLGVSRREDLPVVTSRLVETLRRAAQGEVVQLARAA